MKKLYFVIGITLLICACQTAQKNENNDFYDPYPNMVTLTFNGNRAYEFNSNNNLSENLIIVLEGSGWTSTLGVFMDNEWRFVGFGARFIEVLRDDYTILIPEKWDRVLGINYIDDMDARFLYTRENLIDCYVSTINSYLADNNYSNVFLIGISEGGAVLPVVYEKLLDNELVKGLVSIAAGGLGAYESYLINIEKDNISDFWRDFYKNAINIYDKRDEYYESTELFGGMVVYRQFVSSMFSRPFDSIKNINIPILFVHGVNDMNIAVESTLYIQNNLPEKPFEYIIYEDMGHIPMNEFEMKRFQNDISNWIRNKNTSPNKR